MLDSLLQKEEIFTSRQHEIRVHCKYSSIRSYYISKLQGTSVCKQWDDDDDEDDDDDDDDDYYYYYNYCCVLLIAMFSTYF